MYPNHHTSHTSESVEPYWKICKHKNCTRVFQDMIKLRNHEDGCQARTSSSQDVDEELQSDSHRETPCNIILQLKEIKIILKRNADSKIDVQKSEDGIRPKRSCTKVAMRKIARMTRNTKDHCEIQDEDDIEVYNSLSEYSDDSDASETIRSKKAKKNIRTSTCICPFCELNFSSGVDLNEHKLKYHTKPFACDHVGCEKAFKFRHALASHKIIHDGTRPYKCPHCPKAFADRSGCRRHVRIHTKDYRLTCPFCDKKFTDPTSGNRHVKTHNGEKFFKCRYCDESFINYTVRKSHEFKIHKKGPLAKTLNVPCLDCGRLFYSGSNLNSHLCSSKFKIIEPEIPITEMITSDALEVDPFADTGNDDPLVQSSVANESNSTNIKSNAESSSPSLVEINIRDIMRVPIVHETDDSIDIKYVTEDDMIGKRNDISENSEMITANYYEVIDLKCRVQDDLIASTSNITADPLSLSAEAKTEIGFDLKTYVETFQNSEMIHESSTITIPNLQPQRKRREVEKPKQRVANEEGKFQCEYCEQTFFQVWEVNVHEKSHLPPRTYPCDFPNCGKTFTKWGYLHGHKNVHLTEARYKCNFCDKKYRQAHGLKIHIRVEHTAEKPFKCEHCDQAFVAQQRMKLHVLRHHIKEKPFKCKWCDHRCFVKEKMDCHERLHTGEKPYNCAYCNKSFRMLKRKREHELVHVKQQQNLI